MKYVISLIRVHNEFSFQKDTKTWSDKKPLAYWRGSTTGGKLDLDNMHQFQRHRMLSLYQNHSHFDIAFTGIAQCSHSGCEDRLKSVYRFDQNRDYNYMMQYKYLIDVVCPLLREYLRHKRTEIHIQDGF